ncbi:hypothetical protein ACHHYP_08562 [Achlya hypogyna]|uniref:Uncharacterized protein n=1 Tax=Achlya hypogyna TaxID=1202772 RepID=A0A1V9YP85_ACHHY|nr:hypothetical protein ACHHYP_08562 [Achlya hypogyna]
MDVIEGNVALRELWRRKDEYGLPFVMDELQRLLELGLITEAELSREPGFALFGGHHSAVGLFPRQKPSPPAPLGNQILLALEDRVSSLLDAQAYFPLDRLQAVLEKEFDVDLAAHVDWLQQTIFRLSKQKLQLINQAAALARRQSAATTLQCAYRRQRRTFLAAAAARRRVEVESADNVARRAVLNYALDVIGRFLGLRISRRRFRSALLQWRREAWVEAQCRALRARRASRILTIRLPCLWTARACRAALRARSAKRIQGLVRSYLATRRCARASLVLQRACAAYLRRRQLQWSRHAVGTWTLYQLRGRRRRRWALRRAHAVATLQRWYRLCSVRRRAVAAARFLKAWLFAARSVARLATYCHLEPLFRSERRCARRILHAWRRHVATSHAKRLAAATLRGYAFRWWCRRQAQMRRLLVSAAHHAHVRRQLLAARRSRAMRTIRAAVRRRVAKRRAALIVLRRFGRRVIALCRAAAQRKRLSSGLVPMRPRTLKPHTLPAVTRSSSAPLPPVKLVKRFDRLCTHCARAHGATPAGRATDAPSSQAVGTRGAAPAAGPHPRDAAA